MSAAPESSERSELKSETARSTTYASTEDGAPPQTRAKPPTRAIKRALDARTPLRLLEAMGEVPAYSDAMTYNSNVFSGWRAFAQTSGTVVTDARLWKMMVKLMMLALCVALLTVLTSFDPNSLRVKEFQQIGTYLNVFVGFLLGLFMSISINRWISCIDGLLELADAIRNLQLQFSALGVPKKHINHCIRYGVVSCRILTSQLKRARVFDKGELEILENKMWDDMTIDEGELENQTGEEAEKLDGLYPDEKEQLSAVEDPAAIIWLWVGSFIGRLSEDGYIPNMATPTYGRIMNLAMRAQDSLRHIRSAISVQTPYIYVHTLACVVHLNNILAAVSLGFTLGGTVSLTLVLLGLHAFVPKPQEIDQQPVWEHWVQALETATIACITCFIGPMLYEAFLLISLGVSSPFDEKCAVGGQVPSDRLLEDLISDLKDGNRLSESPPGWNPPSFKKASKS